nr:hypothetical protein [Phytohabitans suffuscus]
MATRCHMPYCWTSSRTQLAVCGCFSFSPLRIRGATIPSRPPSAAAVCRAASIGAVTGMPTSGLTVASVGSEAQAITTASKPSRSAAMTRPISWLYEVDGSGRKAVAGTPSRRESTVTVTPAGSCPASSSTVSASW